MMQLVLDDSPHLLHLYVAIYMSGDQTTSRCLVQLSHNMVCTPPIGTLFNLNHYMVIEQQMPVNGEGLWVSVGSVSVSSHQNKKNGDDIKKTLVYVQSWYKQLFCV